MQVAQVPGRGDPGSPGELNFSYLFQLLEDEGYKGFVGCEYQPQGEGGLRLQAWPWERENWGTGIGQELFSSLWVEVLLPPSPLRRHSGGLELAAFLLGEAKPLTGWPVRSCSPPTCLSGTVNGASRVSSGIKDNLLNIFIHVCYWDTQCLTLHFL